MYEVFLLVIWTLAYSEALNVVLAGGTGSLGQSVASKLIDDDVTILTRNKFLASAPSRVTTEFGWVGSGYLKSHPHVKLRDWDGGDFMDIVGKDWVGWQDDVLPEADAVVHLVGGYTTQRLMACERLVREAFQMNKNTLHVTVSPTRRSMNAVSPGVPSLKLKRVEECEEMVRLNCLNSRCLRLDAFAIEEASEQVVSVIRDWQQQQ